MRLARAICSDVSLYNEEKIVRGIEQDNFFDVAQGRARGGARAVPLARRARPLRAHELLRPRHHRRDPQVEGAREVEDLVARRARRSRRAPGLRRPRGARGRAARRRARAARARTSPAPASSGSSRTGTSAWPGAPPRPPRGCAAASRSRSSCRRPSRPGCVAQDLPLAVLHEDRDLLVLDKAAGHGGPPGARARRTRRVVNALLHRLGGRWPGRGGSTLRLGLVHRLDKDTSGCLVVAKTEAALAALQAQWKGRTVEKVYLALCHGALAPEGRLDTPYGRHPRDRTRFTGTARGRGRRAVTEWRVARGVRRRRDARGGDAPHRPDAPDPRPPGRGRPPAARATRSTAGRGARRGSRRRTRSRRARRGDRPAGAARVRGSPSTTRGPGAGSSSRRRSRRTSPRAGGAPGRAAPATRRRRRDAAAAEPPGPDRAALSAQRHGAGIAAAALRRLTRHCAA